MCGNEDIQVSETMKILTYPESVLLSKSDVVENIDEDIQTLVDNMGATMYAAPGIGLAANQVGNLKRIFVYDLTPQDKGRNLSVIINPEIVQAEGKIEYEEACLSVVDFSSEVTRSAYVKVRGVDRHGNPVDIDAEGLLAVCFQHEIDHLNGVLFLDHVSNLKRSLYKKKLKKILKKEKPAAKL
jgi:peptide deformylase